MNRCKPKQHKRRLRSGKYILVNKGVKKKAKQQKTVKRKREMSEEEQEEEYEENRRQYEEDMKYHDFGILRGMGFDNFEPQILETKDDLALVRYPSDATGESDTFSIIKKGGSRLWSGDTTYAAEFLAEGSGPFANQSSASEEAREKFDELSNNKTVRRRTKRR